MSRLFLVPNLISPNDIDAQIPSYVTEVIKNVDVYIVENVRNARRFMKRLFKEKDIDNITFFELNKHTNKNQLHSFLLPSKDGKDIGLLSEAGVPCVADPGAAIVEIAHQLNIEVIPMVGPSSILLALMGSGMNGQNFTFHGYLPIDKNDRRKKIKELERLSIVNNQTQIFIETPYRNNQILQDIVLSCKLNTRLCLAVEIMAENGYVKTLNISDWKKKLPDLHKKTVVL